MDAHIGFGKHCSSVNCPSNRPLSIATAHFIFVALKNLRCHVSCHEAAVAALISLLLEHEQLLRRVLVHQKRLVH
eukprot:06365_2